jgi:isocitrate/isopropylmalate dehydrogenase
MSPILGSAPKYTGVNKVSPVAQMLSAVFMLRYLGEEKAADKMENAHRRRDRRRQERDLRPAQRPR